MNPVTINAPATASTLSRRYSCQGLPVYTGSEGICSIVRIRRSLGRFCFAQTLIDAPIEEGDDNDGAKQGDDSSSSDKDEKAGNHDEEEDTEQSESDLFVSRQTKRHTCAAVLLWRGTRRLVVLLYKLVFHTFLLTHYAIVRSVSARACLLRHFQAQVFDHWPERQHR